LAAALGAHEAAEGVADLVARLDLPRHLSQWKLGEADLVEAARPVVSAEHSLEDLLGILRAAL
jgi:hypothetical protein